MQKRIFNCLLDLLLFRFLVLGLPMLLLLGLLLLLVRVIEAEVVIFARRSFLLHFYNRPDQVNNTEVA